MERLTDKNDVGNYFYPKCFEKCDGLGASSKCDNCEIMTSVCEKLGKYEDLEEQGRLIILPCNCQHNNNSRDNEPCCRCDSRQTNADRIRNMSDEELAEFLAVHDLGLKGNDLPMLTDWLEWLQSEAE